jgi:hypothetical protein
MGQFLLVILAARLLAGVVLALFITYLLIKLLGAPGSGATHRPRKTRDYLGGWVLVLAVIVVLFLEGPSKGLAYDKEYSEFFTLAGTISVALWISSFAIIALSKYSVPMDASNPPRFLKRLRPTFDVTYSVWLGISFANVSGCLFIAAAISLFMLIPKLSSDVFRVAVLVVVLLTLIVTYAMLTYLTERFDVLKAALDQVSASANQLTRVPKEWAKAKSARLRDLAASLDDAARAEQALARAEEASARAEKLAVLVRRATRSSDQINRVFSALHDSLFKKGISPFGISVYLPLIAAGFIVMFPKPAVACAATLILIFASIILILNLAQTLMLRIPDALSSDKTKR